MANEENYRNLLDYIKEVYTVERNKYAIQNFINHLNAQKEDYCQPVKDVSNWPQEPTADKMKNEPATAFHPLIGFGAMVSAFFSFIWIIRMTDGIDEWAETENFLTFTGPVLAILTLCIFLYRRKKDKEKIWDFERNAREKYDKEFVIYRKEIKELELQYTNQCEDEKRRVALNNAGIETAIEFLA